MSDIEHPKPARRRWMRLAWSVPPILVGAAAVLVALRLGGGPVRIELEERARTVRTIQAEPIAVVPRAVGYGTVQAGRRWEAVAEVSGRVVWVSDALKDGAIAKAGTELLRIEEAPYRLALTLVEAQLRASAAKDRATRASIAIAERDHKLLQADFARNRQLLQRGAISRGALDAVEQRLLSSEAALQNLRNALQINAAERGVTEAQRDVAKLDLQRTALRAPFDVRVTDVAIGVAQYTNKGQRLFSADGLAVAEVEAQFPVGLLRPLVTAAGSQDAGPSAVRGVMALEAQVRLDAGTHTVDWPARVARVAGSIDPQTQSLGVVVAVDDPYTQARPGERPPLYRNTFVQVELRGRPLPNRLIAPRAALHQGRAYVLTEAGRLDIRPVRVAFTQGSFVVLQEGLQAGERIVVSDLVPAVQGMLLDPQDDAETWQRLAAEATGRAGAP